jgi:hypothetical protein
MKCIRVEVKQRYAFAELHVDARLLTGDHYRCDSCRGEFIAMPQQVEATKAECAAAGTDALFMGIRVA